MTSPEDPPPLSAPGIHDLSPYTQLSAPKTQRQMKGIGQAMRYRFLADVLYAIAGIEVFGISPFAGLSAWADDLVERANQAYLGAVGAQASANYANGQLAILNAKNLAAGVEGGVAVSSDFNGASSSNLVGFVRRAIGSGGGSYGLSGNGTATWKKSGGLPRANYDRNPELLATDNHAIQMVLTSISESGGSNEDWQASGGNSYNTLRGRVNAAQTSEVFARVGRSRAWIGCRVDDDEHLFTTAPVVGHAGGVWGFYIGSTDDDREFVLKHDGVVVLTAIDADEISLMGAGYRYVGHGAEVAAGFLTQIKCGDLDAWSAADWVAGAGSSDPLIARLDATSTQGTSTAMPTHAAGDMLIAAAARDGDITPSLPSGWTNLYNGTMFRVGYKIAASGAETSGTWSNADGLSIASYRKAPGTSWATPTQTNANGLSSTITYPELTNSDECLFVRAAGHRTATNIDTLTPDGWVHRTSAGGRYTRIIDTNSTVDGNANGVGADTQSVNRGGFYRSVTIKLTAS